MGDIRVSVVIPCYNAIERGADVCACVQSVCGQAIKGLEVILVDDGSGDGTGDALDALAVRDVRVRVLHKPNGGVSSARNAGLEAARGEWVSFVDSDDALAPDGLQTLLDAARAGDDIVCAAYTAVYRAQGGKEQIFTPEGETRQQVLQSLIRTQGALNSMCARLYRRSFLMEHAIRAPLGVRVGEDVLFNLQAFYYARAFTLLSKSVYTYYLGSMSAMGEAQRDFYPAQRAMLAGIDAFMREHDLKEACFRAQMDTILRQLRRGYGRMGAARRFGREAREALRGVKVLALGKKERCLYAIARYAGFASVLLP